MNQLIQEHYIPYHHKLEKASKQPGIVLGLDCHTMLDVGPTKASTDWERRPMFCISNRGSQTSESLKEPITAPSEWMIKFKEMLEKHFKDIVDEQDSRPLVMINNPLYMPGFFHSSAYVNPDHIVRMKQVKQKLYEGLRELVQEISGRNEDLVKT